MIKLGPGNDEAAKEALKAWPGALQVGGGINADNALSWLEAGASKVRSVSVSIRLYTLYADSLQVIVTSYLFPGMKLSLDRLRALSDLVGKDRLVVDVRCARCTHLGNWTHLYCL